MESRSGKLTVTEDGLACIAGFIIIILALAVSGFPVPAYGWNSTTLFEKVLTPGNLFLLLIYSLLGVSIIMIANRVLKGSWQHAWKSALLIVVIGQLALMLAGNQSVKLLNLEAVIFSLFIGLLINHTISIPQRWRDALPSELLIKIGLVLLGTTVIFSDILKAGSLGLVQALLVVLAVWYFAFWLCKRLKLDEEMSMMLSSAVSICGVSAAIATAGAIQGDEKKLSFVISLVLVTAIPMMIAMPYLAEYLQLSEPVTGAWLGGTIDTTGAVVAAGSMAGETALKYSTIVKFSQNVLLGLAAFAISIYWTYRKHESSVNNKPSARVIWQRFPKFVLGFIAASLLFSFILSIEQVASAKDGLKSIQMFFFVIAFAVIGLETKLTDILSSVNRKPLFAFLIAQLFNIIFTLGIAWLLFKHVTV